ncbi:MAG: hypothetical protein ACXIUO_01200 [Erythrobacter sp.]
MTGKQVIGALAAMALLGACSGASGETDEADAASVVASAPAAPDPSTCPPPEYAYDAEEFGPRTDPLVVPASIATIAATDNTNLAVTTLTGGQMCKDFSWAYNFSNEARSFLDGRLVALGWGAYEAFGTMLFDRAGKGTQVEVGEWPALSPSQMRIAALQLSQSGYGGLEGFAIWQITPSGLSEIHRLPDDHGTWEQFPTYQDFHIDRWQGEGCLLIYAFADDDLAAVDFDRARAKRSPFHASERAGWQIVPGACG